MTSTALIPNVAPPLHKDKDGPRQIEGMEDRKHKAAQNAAICPTDDEVVERARDNRRKHKQSWDYIWRTGVAGGLAGSAVCEWFSFGV
jgi:solute carrier family 25 protein 16